MLYISFEKQIVIFIKLLVGELGPVKNDNYKCGF